MNGPFKKVLPSPKIGRYLGRQVDLVDLADLIKYLLGKYLTSFDLENIPIEHIYLLFTGTLRGLSQIGATIPNTEYGQ